MLDRVSIHNFKSLRDVQIELQPFTVFVGANGSGKSSVLQAINLICRAFLPHAANCTGELRQRSSRGTDGLTEISVKSDEASYRVQSFTPGERINEKEMLAQIQSKGRSFASEASLDLDQISWGEWDDHRGLPHLPSSVLLRMEYSKLIQANPGPNPRRMEPDGIGIHSTLANMALNDPDSWQNLQSDLRKIIPSIRRLRHSVADQENAAALIFDTVGAEDLPASQVSEGTLLVLGLLTAIYAPNRASLILLDDLDRGLHPQAQRELITLLRRLQDSNPELQILASTHSPYLLDCMEPAEVRMTFLDNGATVCAPLSNHPSFQKWKDEMHPGELWSMFGEGWVADQAKLHSAESASE